MYIKQKHRKHKVTHTHTPDPCSNVATVLAGAASLLPLLLLRPTLRKGPSHDDPVVTLVEPGVQGP